MYCNKKLAWFLHTMVLGVPLLSILWRIVSNMHSDLLFCSRWFGREKKLVIMLVSFVLSFIQFRKETFFHFSIVIHCSATSKSICFKCLTQSISCNADVIFQKLWKIWIKKIFFAQWNNVNYCTYENFGSITPFTYWEQF